ncbi:MAG TPA: HAMP domain-containing sensor histidine kinase [Trueperaceae bacterium]
MIAHTGLSLRWRIAVLASLAIALLSVVASIAAFWVVRSSLIGDLQRALRDDVANVARIYRSEEGSAAQSAPTGPTGGVIIQVYDTEGRLLLASDEVFSKTALPTDVVLAARKSTTDWRGQLANRPVQAALAPYPYGVVAVLAQTSYITEALAQLARALGLTALVLVALSGLTGYLVAGAAMRPITQLARSAAKLGPDHLSPIQYRGPNDELGQLSGTLNELIARLKESMDAQRSFLAETSHELRTPLTSLQGFLERAVRRADPESRRELADARRIARSMSRLVADLLQLSRGELVRELVPHLLDPATDILGPVGEEFPGVCVEAAPGEILIGDPERLRQLVRNLTANAVRAAGANAVTLRLQPETDWLTIEVSDRGPGIPPDVLPRIFDKFYKGAGGGAGLGLAIAKQIAEMHHAELHVTSTPGQGTTFTLRLPRLEEEG